MSLSDDLDNSFKALGEILLGLFLLIGLPVIILALALTLWSEVLRADTLLVAGEPPNWSEIKELTTLTDADLERVVADANRMLRDLQQDEQISRVIKMKERFHRLFVPREGFDGVSQFREVYNWRRRLWERRMERRRPRLLSRYDLVHYLVPAQLHNDGLLYFGGQARKTCGARERASFYRRSISSVATRQTNGEPRLDYVAVGVAHEIGHLLGADHFDSLPNLMHSGAMGLTRQYGPILPVSDVSRRQVFNCLGGR